MWVELAKQQSEVLVEDYRVQYLYLKRQDGLPSCKLMAYISLFHRAF
jgi:hypothetical protein